MKVIYYNPRFLAASFISAYLHTNPAGGQVSYRKVEETIKILDAAKPFLLFFGRGKNGEEVYVLNGKFPEPILCRGITGFLNVYGKNPGELLMITPLSGNNVFLTLAIALRSDRMKKWAYNYYMGEIEASVERACIQAELFRIGV